MRVLGFTPCCPLPATRASDLAAPSTRASHGEPADRTEATVLQSLMREVTSITSAVLCWLEPTTGPARSRGATARGKDPRGPSPNLRAQVRISNSISPTGSAKRHQHLPRTGTGQSPDKVPCDPRVAPHAPEFWDEELKAGLSRAAQITQVGEVGLSCFQSKDMRCSPEQVIAT